MGREINFRAWEKNLKEIIPVHNIDFVNRMINTESAWRLFAEIELMQYTGLKDKNDKEIFESDITSGRNRSWDLKARNEQVTFLNGCFMFGNWNAHEYFNKHQEIEVIGNIYENPELLEGKIDD